jgi:two-component sensor histidine kinase
MASTAELIRTHTGLGRRPTSHLLRLVASWGLLADLSFADLLLFAPVGGDPERFVALAQVRPLTSQTLYRGDFIGTEVRGDQRPNVARCWQLGEIIDGERTHDNLRETVRELCIPVRCDGETVAVLTRETAPSVGRQPGELERTYIEIFNRIVRMVASGEFPFPHAEGLADEPPRVGDGVLLLDASSRVAYASPNAVSALHRIGVHANTEGMRLSELGLQDTAVRAAFDRGVPATEEVERGPEVTVLLHCLPLREHGTVSGAMVLLRDISELRRRDRLLVSKDATIREIHHRVKNNLQTISSLLRLQGRRLSSPEARTAIEESVRRIRSIALVHETLSHEAGDELDFDDIVRPLVRMVEEGLLSPDSPVSFEVQGDAGVLPATMATSLAVVLTELLQNVVDHAYPPGRGVAGGRVLVRLANDGRHLRVSVTDDGVGLPESFDLASATGLGLSIVRTLVTSELRGEMDMRRGSGGGDRPGTEARIVVPVHDRSEPLTGTVPVVRAGEGPPEPGRDTTAP